MGNRTCLRCPPRSRKQVADNLSLVEGEEGDYMGLRDVEVGCKYTDWGAEDDSVAAHAAEV